VSYPPDLAGASLLGPVTGGAAAPRDRLFAANEKNLSATFDERFKLVATPTEAAARYALYDRREDPAEAHDAAGRRPDDLRVHRRALELFQERADREWGSTRNLLQGVSGEVTISR